MDSNKVLVDADPAGEAVPRGSSHSPISPLGEGSSGMPCVIPSGDLGSFRFLGMTLIKSCLIVLFLCYCWTYDINILLGSDRRRII